MITNHGKNGKVVALAVFFVLAGVRSAQSWQSFMHQSLVSFSQMGKLDVKVKGKQSIIVKGADAPDRKKPFKPTDHYTAARFRAVRSFDGAVDLHKEGQALEKKGDTEKAEKKYEESADALGNAFHYIEDLAASEKVVDAPGFLPMIGPKEHKAIVQGLAEKMVNDLAHNKEAFSGFRRSAAKYTETTFRKYNNLLQMLVYLQSQLGSYGGQARKVFADAQKNGWNAAQRDAELNKVIRLNLLLTVACLDRTIELYNEQTKSYYALLEVTFPVVKEEIKPKRGERESKEAFAARKKAFYDRLTMSDVVFKPLPLENARLVLLVTGKALEVYPRDRITSQPKWALPVSASGNRKDGTVTSLSGAILLTVKGLYDTQKQMMDSYPFFKKAEEKEPIQPIVFDAKDGKTSGVSEGRSYAAGPLTEGWTDADRQRAFELGKAVAPLYDCFIAHAVYGDPSAHQIEIFRRFRDKILRRTDAGRRLIDLYYERGPWLALELRQDPQALAEMRTRLDLLAILLDRADMDDPWVQCMLNLPVRWADRLTAGQQRRCDRSLLDLVVRAQARLLDQLSADNSWPQSPAHN